MRGETWHLPGCQVQIFYREKSRGLSFPAKDMFDSSTRSSLFVCLAGSPPVSKPIACLHGFAVRGFDRVWGEEERVGRKDIVGSHGLRLTVHFPQTRGHRLHRCISKMHPLVGRGLSLLQLYLEQQIRIIPVTPKGQSANASAISALIRPKYVSYKRRPVSSWRTRLRRPWVRRLMWL